MNNLKYYDKNNHISNLVSDSYYKDLITIRNTVAVACDEYFQKLDAPRVDLFLISKSVSSPMGKGSDSLPIEIEFDTQHAYLSDSSQFGMEPLVLKNFKMVYCYLPSFRGEDPNDRHLNQFFHCESELRGGYEKCMSVAEGLVKHIIKNVLKLHSNTNIANLKQNLDVLNKIVDSKFPVISFDEADDLLKSKGLSNLIERKDFGRVLTNEGELKITELVGKNVTPVWITKYDRDTVPFYQKPDPTNKDRVLNGDLIFPAFDGGFGGEILGLGQRQDVVEEILDSMSRQDVKGVENYNWYIDLRKNKDYSTTSGFGMGIERLIAWFLGIASIIDTSIYPVLKDDNVI